MSVYRTIGPLVFRKNEIPGHFSSQVNYVNGKLDQLRQFTQSEKTMYINR